MESGGKVDLFKAALKWLLAYMFLWLKLKRD